MRIVGTICPSRNLVCTEYYPVHSTSRRFSQRVRGHWRQESSEMHHSLLLTCPAHQSLSSSSTSYCLRSQSSSCTRRASVPSTSTSRSFSARSHQQWRRCGLPQSLVRDGSIRKKSRHKNVIQAADVETSSTADMTEANAMNRGISSELRKLLDLLPEHLRIVLEEHEEIDGLVEIVLDLGRKPMARLPSGDWFISQDLVTAADLGHAVSLVGEFADDNRAGMDRTLHRISAIRNRSGRIVGLTCRVGRAISGSAEMVRDLVAGGDSLLLMGPPGVGKTTAIREIARMLADDYHKRVVIVDTSNEIAGDGDIPHVGIGRARRMQVPKVDLQHEVMIEAVENHMPQTIVIDEIGTELEAFAAGTIAQRGVQLVGTAHGMTVENLIKNPSLQILAGGIQSVTLGDEEARRRRVQKSVLERKGPPTFPVAVEMVSRNEWKVHRSLAATVDYLLAGRPPKIEYRRMTSDGKVEIGNEESFRDSSDTPSASSRDDETDYESDDEDDESDDEVSQTASKGQQTWEAGDPPLYLYAYQVTEASLEQVMEVMGLENAVQLTSDIGTADVVLALRSKLKQNPWVRGMAKYRQLPVFAIKANTMAQMVRAMRAILGMESLAANTLVQDVKGRIEDMGSSQHQGPTSRRATAEDEIDALEEARLAIEQLVIPKGQPVELLPRSPEIIALQIKLVEGYQLATEKSGTELNLRLRILPRVSSGGAYEVGNTSDEWDEEVNIEGGKSVVRLPILPE